MRDWPTVRLDDVADIRISNVDKKSVTGERPVRLCNYMDVYGNDYIDGRLDFMEATAAAAEIERFKLQRGDVLMTKDSETPDDIGISAVMIEDVEGLVAGYHLALIRPRRDGIDPVYLAKQLSAAKAVRHLSRRAAGSTRYGLSISTIASTPVAVPPLAVQRYIGEILSTLDNAINRTEALVAKSEQVKAGLLEQLLSHGVSSNGTLRAARDDAPHLYKETRVGWLPIGWEVKELQMLADVSRGKFTVRPRNDPRYYGGEYPFIQTGDVALARGRILTDFGQTVNRHGLSVSKLFPVGTIMVTIAANIADTCILGVPMCAPDSLVGVTPKAGENVRFLELSIRSKKRWLEGRAPQTAQRNINLEDLRPLLIASPDRTEQAAIAATYEAADSSTECIERDLVKLQLQKAGLMCDLFSGEVRVNGLAA